MIKVLFVCHGNICRSPMAEYVMKDLVKKSNLSDQFHISSAATSTEEIGKKVTFSEITGKNVMVKDYSIGDTNITCVRHHEEWYQK